DEEDPDSVALPDEPPHEDRPLVLGVPRQVAQVSLEPEVAAAFAVARDNLVRAGIEVRDVDIPQWEPARLRRSAFIVAEVEGAVSFADLLADDDSDITPAFRKMLEFGRDLPAPRYASARRHCIEVGVAARRVVQGVDALFLPTTPQRAFAHDAAPPPDQADLTALANAGGLPAISFPASTDSRPIGLQLIGRALRDRRLLEIARRVQGALAPA
ncbi:MAG TPA: amidase family protein, partial [Saliniramus sp.]|nr:amidase family protein [Saliniramus sp.]